MKTLWPSLLFVFILVGCDPSPTPSQMQPPSVAGVKSTISEAQLANEDAIQKAKVIYDEGAPAKAPISLSLEEDTAKIKGDLIDANSKADVLQLKVNTQTAQINKETTRLDYIEPKYSEAVGKIWWWRIAAIGSWVAIIGFFVLRQYLPFLKLI